MASSAGGPKWALSAASVLGLGFSPKMPGTVGSAACFLLYIPAYFSGGTLAYAILASELVLVLALAALALPKVLAVSESKDPSFVVLDELAGMLCAFLLAGSHPVKALLAFVFFRVLDIFKPFPIGRLERLPGAWGVMADDIAAGILAGLIAHAAVIMY